MKIKCPDCGWVGVFDQLVVLDPYESARHCPRCWWTYFKGVWEEVEDD